MQAEYKKWMPIEGLERELWVEAVHDDYEGFRILMKGSSPSSATLCIHFKHYYLYRNVDETYRMKLWQEGNFEERNWALYTTTSSQLIEWFNEENDGVQDKGEMMHYLIKTGADVIEVLTNRNAPDVKWLTAPGDSQEAALGHLVKRGKRGSYYDKV